MARIVLGSYLVRYPLGGMMSWVLQYLAGFSRLGHEIYFVEKADYPLACFDPSSSEMTDDCRHGTGTVHELLAAFGLGANWCFVDYENRYYGMSQGLIEEILSSADLFIDMGTHGSWQAESEGADLKVLIDGEPAFTQLKMQKKLAEGRLSDAYDLYYTTGQNIGTHRSSAVTGGREWRHLFHPVCTDAVPYTDPVDSGKYTTVMNWQSYEPIQYEETCYRHKDVEFQKFLDLPRHTTAELEVAVSGAVPRKQLQEFGWGIENAHDVTISYESFFDYIHRSRGEFSVCKNGYVDSNSGWFSDRSAAYLASGRPVVMQETGFSEHLPTGEGLFAVRTADEAAAALDEIERDYHTHCLAARRIAEEYLDTSVVLSRFLEQFGIFSHPESVKGAEV